MSLFSVFACLDAFFMFFYLLLGNSVVGITFNNNYQIAGKVLDFAGYYRLGISSSVANMEDGFLAIFTAVMLGIVMVAFCAASFLLFAKIREYMTILMNTHAGAQYDKDNKPPVIFSFIMAGFYLVLAVISLLAGVWVDAIIQLGTALFLGAGAWAFMLVHKELRSTSAE